MSPSISDSPFSGIQKKYASVVEAALALYAAAHLEMSNR